MNGMILSAVAIITEIHIIISIGVILMQEHTTAAAMIILILVTGTADKMSIIRNGIIIVDKFITIFTASTCISSAIFADNVITN